jgi:hypothetical protein
MKKQFHGYYKPTQKEFDQLWADAIFAFDANSLLHLYLYSEDTRGQLLHLLEQLQERVWLPYQAAEEYQRNRASNVVANANKYEELKGTIAKAKDALIEHKQHPFIPKELLSQFTKIIESVETALDDGGGKLKAYRHNDPIRDQLDAIFDGRVGEMFPAAELE